ncbi:MAG: LysR family transcriptional regulator [Methylobacterium sp.]|nr:LysR family transcriptional regulator [Methylobacterium sp.]
MALDIRHLRSFVLTAQEAHFGKAAARLNVTQPALSRTIRQLEAVLGGALFSRSTRSVVLTDLGATFLSTARQAVASFDGACVMGQQLARGEVGQMLLGHTEIAIFGQLPRILQRFRDQYPKAQVALSPGFTRENIERVLNGALDAAFVTGHASAADLDCVGLWKEESIVVLPADHRMARRRSIHIKDLADEPFVMGPNASWQAYRPLVEAACKRNGFDPRVVREADSSSALVHLIASGEGITIHPACIRNVSGRQVVFRDLVGASIEVETCLIARQDSRSKLVANFRDIAKSCCAVEWVNGIAR